MFHDVARQVFRQRLAFRFPPWPDPYVRFRRIRLRSGGRGLCLVFLEIAKDRLQLIDRTP